jgi:hypothetical protein
MKRLFHEKSWLYMSNHLEGDEQVIHLTMKKSWWLGFLGFIGFIYVPSMLLYFEGEASASVFLNMLWFLWFTSFIPIKK